MPSGADTTLLPEADELTPEMLALVLDVPIVDNLRRYGGFTPHPDDRVRQRGARGMLYVRDLLRDNHLRSCIETRANNAIVPGYTVDAIDGDETGAEFIRDCLARTDFPFVQIMRAVLYQTVGFGFHVAQRIWKIQNIGPYAGRWTIANLKPIPAELVKFDHDEAGNLKPDGIVIQPSANSYGAGEQRFQRQHFLHTRWGYTANPYGEALALECDFWVWAKSILSKFRLVHAEKYGSPTVQAKLSRVIKRGSTEWYDLVRLLEDLQNNSVSIVPPGIVLDLLQSQRSGDLDYDNAYDRGNKEISKVILGSTQTTEGAGHGQSGGYAQAKVMGGTTDNYAWLDAIWLESVIQQQIVNPIWYMNFGSDRPAPQLRILDDDYARQVAMANVFVQLMQAGMTDIPLSHVRREMNIPLPVAGEPVLQLPAALSPASPIGIDNKLFRAPRFAAPVVAVQSSVDLATLRLETLDNLQQDSLKLLAVEIEFLFAALTQAVEHLPEGEPLATPPSIMIAAPGLNTALSRGLWQHYLTGKWFATREIETQLPAGDTVPGASAKVPKLVEKFRAQRFAADPNLPADLLAAAEALKLIGQTIPVTAAEVQSVANFYQELGQSVAGLIETDVRTIFEKLALGQKNGWSVREFQAAIREAGLKYAGDLLTPAAAGTDMTANHVETIYRNHMMRAFSDGKDALAGDPETGDIVAGFTFRSVGDDRTRPLHAALDGVSLTVTQWNGEFKYLKPPIHHNCRCDREIVTIFDVERGHTWTDPATLPAYDPAVMFHARPA